MMMDYWQLNAQWCRTAQPGLWRRLEQETDDSRYVVTPSRSGEPTLRIGTAQLHSSYDPRREASALAEKTLERADSAGVLVVFGLGLGYLTEALLAGFTGRIVAIEPDLGVMRAALRVRDISVMTRVEWAVGLSTEAALEVVDKALGGGNWQSVKIVPHPPSVNLHPEYFAELARLINARRNALTGKLTILVNTPVYGGSLPVARYCASAFQRLGHRVEVLDNEIYDSARQRIDGLTGNRRHRGQLTGLMTTLMAESLTARALDRAVDLVFCVAQSPISPPVLKELKRHKIPVAFWFVEDWQLFGYWRDWAPLYDYFFTIQKGEFTGALNRLGVKRSRYLPLAADPEVHRPLELTAEERVIFGSAVSHIGAGYRNRQRVFSGLTDLDFKLWGNDWNPDSSLARVLQRGGARLSTEESVKVFNAAQINLNLHSSAFHDGVNPEGDFVNPRTFELAACGAFQLTDHRSLLPELFRADGGAADLEMATFGHESQLRGLIEYYLAHPDERRQIAANARRRTLAEHTYELRMAEALRHIYSYEETPASRLNPNHIDNLLAEAGDDPDLRQLLAGLQDRSVVTLDDIATEIGKKQGELTPTEATFLLMYEFRRWAAEKELL
jgi:spore maturation protein CgeB